MSNSEPDQDLERLMEKVRSLSGCESVYNLKLNPKSLLRKDTSSVPIDAFQQACELVRERCRTLVFDAMTDADKEELKSVLSQRPDHGEFTAELRAAVENTACPSSFPGRLSREFLRTNPDILKAVALVMDARQNTVTSKWHVCVCVCLTICLWFRNSCWWSNNL
jgi:hypothetical protein